VSGVGNNPDSISPVGGIDGASWYKKRLDGVPFSFQVRKHLVEHHPVIPISKPANILSHNPAGFSFSYDSKHLRPEVAVIF
jgi:hypothetical protein